MIAANQSNLKRLRDLFFQEARSSEIRTIRGFAEAEVVLPMDDGPHEGEYFSCSYQPVAGLWFDEIEKRRYLEYHHTGPKQAGKTLMAVVVPIAYQLAEMRKNAIFAVPDANMADDKFRMDVKPVFNESDTLSKLLPTNGPGSRGGKVTNTVTLTNSSVIKFMTPFGDDANRAGFTGPVAFVTEAARFSNPSSNSVEADPLRQISGRQRSQSKFNADGTLNTRRMMIVEGTVTVENELPWSARANSTNTRVACPCPHCKTYVTPEREHLMGWQDQPHEMAAAQNSHFMCPSCGEKISEQDRHDMNQNAVLVSEGQTVTKRGQVRGNPPETTKFWLRWNAFNNLFTTAADLGAEEWAASQIEEETPERDNAEKDLCQSAWVIPFVSKMQFGDEPIKRGDVSKRQESFGIGILPPDTTHLTVGIDVGLRTLWFFVLAFRECGQVHCPLYAAHETSIMGKKPEHLENHAVRQALEEIHDRINAGFPVHESGEIMKPNIVFIDSRYKTSVVFDFCNARHESGRMTLNSTYWPIQGRGQSQIDRSSYRQAKKGGTVRRVGDGWHIVKDKDRRGYRIELDADRSKLDIQECLRVQNERGEIYDSTQDEYVIGALTLYNAPKKEHLRVDRHLSSEICTIGKNLEKVWTKSGQNHLLDCAGYAHVAGRFAGYKFPKPAPKQKAKDSGGWFSKQLAK